MKKITIGALAALIVVLLLVSVLPMSTSSSTDTSRGSGDIDVLVLWCDFTDNGVSSMLNSEGRFGTVVSMNGRVNTPSVTTLLQYDVVVTWTNYPYQNAVTMGNNMKTYVDNGGGVLLLAFSSIGTSWPGYQLQGSFYSMGYNPIGYSTSYGLNYATRIGTIIQPSHAILDGVSDVGPGFHIYTTSMSAGASPIFYWNNGYMGCAIKEIGPGKVCGLNQQPGFDQGVHRDLIIANAAAWCAGISSIAADVDLEPQSLNLESTGNFVSFKVYGFPDNPEYTPWDIDSTTCGVEDVGADLKYGTYNNNKYIGKADRLLVEDAIGAPGAEVEVGVSGKLNDGTSFEGTTTIKAL